MYSMSDAVAESYSNEGRSILIVGYKFVYAYQFLVTFGTFIFNFFTRHQIDAFLKMITKFDEAIEIMNWNFKVNHVKNYWNMFFWIGISSTSLTFIYVLQIVYVTPSKETLDLFYSFLFAFVTKANTMTIFEFVFSSYCIQSRLDILNQNAK